MLHVCRGSSLVMSALSMLNGGTRLIGACDALQVARDIVGRLMADPAFVQKMCIEQMLTIGCNVSWEYQQRRDRFWKELDFVAINTLSLMAATGGLVWLMAPNRASGVLKV